MMIPCPHCDHHIPKPAADEAVVCPFCKGMVGPESAEGWSLKTKIAIGMGIVIVTTIGVVKIFGSEVEPKFQSAYGSASDVEVTF